MEDINEIPINDEPLQNNFPCRVARRSLKDITQVLSLESRICWIIIMLPIFITLNVILIGLVIFLTSLVVNV
jgi:hypothetical protein